MCVCHYSLIRSITTLFPAAGRHTCFFQRDLMFLVYIQYTFVALYSGFTVFTWNKKIITQNLIKHLKTGTRSSDRSNHSCLASYLLIRHVFPTATSPTTMTLAMLKLPTGRRYRRMRHTAALTCKQNPLIFSMRPCKCYILT